MTMTIAKALWDARVNGTVMPLDDLSSIDSPTAGYDAMCEQIEYSGQPLAGWKIGATADASLSVLGLDEAFIGPVPAKQVFDDGAAVGLHPAHMYFAEVEITLVLNKALPVQTQPRTKDELLAAIGTWRTSLEIVGIRVGGGPKGLGPKIIADGGGHHATVLGQSIDPAEITQDLSVEIQIDGETSAVGGPKALNWDGLAEALEFVVARQARLPRSLEAGDILMTGTLTGMTPIQSGQYISATFNGQKCVEATLIKA